MFRWLFSLFLILCLGVMGVSAQDTPRLSVIIDTDMAADDWRAMLYLLQRTDVDVLAVTVTGTGEAHCDPGVQNALNLLLLAGNPEIPVACGRETPLAGDHAFPDALRASDDSMAGLTLPTNPNPPSSLNAVELLSEQINAASQNVTLITLGPLTNIAELLDAEPGLIDKLDMIYIMGGAVGVPGNIPGLIETDNTTAEWNIYIDPLAANKVLLSGAPITLVPLDATNQAPMSMAFYNRLASDRTTPEAEFVYQSMAHDLEGIRGGWLSFWDPLTAVAATDRHIVTIQGRPISVITDEGSESGRTIPDGRGGHIDVAVGANTAAFERIFLNVLNGREPDASLPPSVVTAAGSEENTVVVQRYFEEIWGAQNWDTVEELVDETYINHQNSNSGTGFVGNRDSLIETVRSIHMLGPDMTLTIQEIIVAGDTAAVRFMLEGTHTSSFFNVEPTGNPISISVNSMLHLENGRIVEEWQTLDFFGVFVSIGLIPEDVLAALYEGEN